MRLRRMISRLFVMLLLPGTIATAIPRSIAKTPVTPGYHEVKWVPAQNGERPHNAIEIGRERHGENAGEMLYVCRARHANGTHPGKLIGSTCNIGYGGTEIAKTEYEVAVYSGGFWRAGGRRGALVGGFENDDDLLYVCRAQLRGDLVQKYLPELERRNYGTHGGKLLADGICHFGYGGKEVLSADYELFYP